VRCPYKVQSALVHSPAPRSTISALTAPRRLVDNSTGQRHSAALFPATSYPFVVLSLHLRDSRCIVVHLRRSVRMPATLLRPFSHPHSHQRRQQQRQVYPTKRRPRALPRSTTVGTRLPVPRSARYGLTQSPSESAAAEPTREGFLTKGRKS